MTPVERERILAPELVARLARFRLLARRRVQGRYAGAHASKRYGSSLDFADYREYVAGDDPRRVDMSAYLRLGRLLVKLYEAEDEANVRVVLDLSASMGFGAKQRVAREIAAAFASLAASGQDRVRILVAGATDSAGAARGANGGAGAIDAGPWLRGPSSLAAAEHRLLTLSAPPPGEAGAGPGRADLTGALRRANGEGPRGPVVLISDLLFDGWEDVLRVTAAGRGDALCVHLLGREDLEPSERGDLRLVDSETGDEVEVGIAEHALTSYALTRDRWLADVERTCGQHGIAYARVVDDESVETLVMSTLRGLGVVA